jgi:hypothetical protein
VKSPLFDDVPFGSPLQGCVLDQRTVWGIAVLLGFVLIYYIAEALLGPAPNNPQPAFSLPSGMAGFAIDTATERDQVQAVLDYAAGESAPAIIVETGGRVIWYTRDEKTGFYCPPDIDDPIEQGLRRCERYAVPFQPDFVITPAPTPTESVPLPIGKS